MISLILSLNFSLQVKKKVWILYIDFVFCYHADCLVLIVVLVDI